MILFDIIIVIYTVWLVYLTLAHISMFFTNSCHAPSVAILLTALWIIDLHIIKLNMDTN